MDRWTTLFVAVMALAFAGTAMTSSTAHETTNLKIASDSGASAWPALAKRTPLLP
jgi:hypothetical protein